MRIGGSDYKLLEMFVAVVDANGISSAQTVLGKDTSTISRAIARLEERLGIHLCDRGRQGFSLTPEGYEVYQTSLALVATFRRLEEKIDAIKGVSAGRLKIAMIDNIVSDPNCPLTRVLADLSRTSSSRNKGLQTSISVMSPDQMEQQLLGRRIDLAIGIFESHKPGVTYHRLYQEVDYLYCSSQNPLASCTNESLIEDALSAQRFVTRNFLDGSELRPRLICSSHQVQPSSTLSIISGLSPQNSL